MKKSQDDNLNLVFPFPLSFRRLFHNILLFVVPKQWLLGYFCPKTTCGDMMEQLPLFPALRGE
jgi:hypothetical protein